VRNAFDHDGNRKERKEGCQHPSIFPVQGRVYFWAAQERRSRRETRGERDANPPPIQSFRLLSSLVY